MTYSVPFQLQKLFLFSLFWTCLVTYGEQDGLFQTVTTRRPLGVVTVASCEVLTIIATPSLEPLSATVELGVRRGYFTEACLTCEVKGLSFDSLLLSKYIDLFTLGNKMIILHHFTRITVLDPLVNDILSVYRP